MNTWRNRLAARINAWVLVHIATEDYCDYIESALRYGMPEARRDVRAARTVPRDKAIGRKSDEDGAL